jgi:ABC-type transport system involved in cytochrome bd biosynthesis fused ATPase/permease subunit
MQTPLGEGGALVSGGEGQRVRLGRGLLREDPRLVVLDEPFRGLDRAKRRELLDRLRDRWRDVTLLCVTHDVRETLDFPRVLVVDAGRVVEDGDPKALAAAADSKYRALLDAEDHLRDTLWSDRRWRRWRMDAGKLLETPREKGPR